MARRPLGSTLALLAAALLTAAAATVAYVFVVDVPDRRPLLRLSLPGIETPPTHRGHDAEIEDEAQVIGVLAAGEARAYVLDAFLAPAGHVVNDIIGTQPITVAYCPSCDTVKVFAGRHGGPPLSIGVGGLYERQMLLSWRGRLFAITSLTAVDGGRDEFPYREVPFERTDWESWLARHPDTDVYLGPINF